MALAQLHAYGPQLSSARAARTMALPVLAELPGPVAEDALLVVSELITNGLVHARTEIELHVRVQRNSVFIAVRDESARPLELKDAAPLDTGGRGLHIVEALAERWGVHTEPQGKVVWCQLRADRARPSRPGGPEAVPAGESPGHDEQAARLGGPGRWRAGRRDDELAATG
jgi:anti-sigma regulatory factor (Ser/Thr protein kinase)